MVYISLCFSQKEQVAEVLFPFLFRAILPVDLLQKMRIIGHNAVSTEEDQMLHLLGSVDRKIMHGRSLFVLRSFFLSFRSLHGYYVEFSAFCQIYVFSLAFSSPFVLQ